jgi:hypothetical protein
MDELQLQELIKQTIRISLQQELLFKRPSRAYDGTLKPVKGGRSAPPSNRKTTGRLFQSIDVQFNTPPGQNPDIVIAFPGAPEWYWVNYGRKGKKQNVALKYPPLNTILEWISIKGVFPYKDANGRLISKESQAYLIQRSIGEYGVYGIDFVNQAILKTEMKLRNQIGEYASQYFRTKINDIIIIANRQTR